MTIEDSPSPWGKADATYLAVGEQKGVSALVDRFYEIMASDPKYRVIWDMHPPQRDVSRDKLSRFLCAWMGGPRLYKEKYGAISIPGVHAHLPISNEEKSMWLDCMRDALHSQGHEQALIDYLIKQFEVPAGRIVTASKPKEA
jgi:hemoglobin